MTVHCASASGPIPSMNKSGLPAAADSAPAVKDGVELVLGIISTGDVLKHRLGEVQLEANVLRDYAMAARG